MDTGQIESCSNEHADDHPLSPRGAYESLNLAFARFKRMCVAAGEGSDTPIACGVKATDGP
jgi:hypothetical protein